MKPKIIIFDMDGTLIRNTDSLLLLCDINGMDPQVLQTVTERYLAQEITWIQGDYILAKELAGLRADTLPQEFDRRVRVIGGLPRLLNHLKQRGCTTVLLSAGASCIVDIMMQKYAFDYAIGSTYEVIGGIFTGEITDHIGDAGKVDRVRALCERLGADFGDCVAIGDGESDIVLFRELHRTIALNAAVQLRERASCSVDTEDISELAPLIEKLLAQQPASAESGLSL